MAMSLHDLPRLFRTVQHLRPSQIYWRGRSRLRRKLTRVPAVLSNGSPISLAGEFAAAIGPFDSSRPEEKILARLVGGTFEHLNQSRKLGRPPDWPLGQTDKDRLWIVTLYYHRWAYDLACLAKNEDAAGQAAADLFVEYLTDWIDRCDVTAAGAAPLAWNAYAVATRIIWWIRSALLLGSAWWSDRAAFQTRFLTALSRQANYLADNLEWDLRGNHLLRDAVGLGYAGRFFDGPQAARWLETATALAADQVREQVLPDGGHFERSPLYHLRVMDDLNALSNLIEDPAAVREIESALARMAEFARWVRHPDGGIPLFNDAALEAGGVPEIATAPPSGGRFFPETGLAVWHGTPWTVFFDVGPIGPDEQPGHGHADTLTLECSYDGVRLFVDPGTHSYDLDARRAYDRSTAAHNTVCVDNADSSEVWHIFRVGRRARPLRVDVRADQHALTAAAAHDGYAHLHGVIHHRSVNVEEGGPLTVVDRIEGSGEHRLEGGWLVEPGWSVSPHVRGWELRTAHSASRSCWSLPESSAARSKSGPGIRILESKSPRRAWLGSGKARSPWRSRRPSCRLEAHGRPSVGLVPC